MFGPRCSLAPLPSPLSIPKHCLSSLNNIAVPGIDVIRSIRFMLSSGTPLRDTPILDLAVRGGFVSLVRYLLDHGLHPNEQMLDGAMDQAIARRAESPRQSDELKEILMGAGARDPANDDVPEPAWEDVLDDDDVVPETTWENILADGDASYPGDENAQDPAHDDSTSHGSNEIHADPGTATPNTEFQHVNNLTETAEPTEVAEPEQVADPVRHGSGEPSEKSGEYRSLMDLSHELLSTAASNFQFFEENNVVHLDNDTIHLNMPRQMRWYVGAYPDQAPFVLWRQASDKYWSSSIPLRRNLAPLYVNKTLLDHGSRVFFRNHRVSLPRYGSTTDYRPAMIYHQVREWLNSPLWHGRVQKLWLGVTVPTSHRFPRVMESPYVPTIREYTEMISTSVPGMEEMLVEIDFETLPILENGEHDVYRRAIWIPAPLKHGGTQIELKSYNASAQAVRLIRRIERRLATIRA